jgi:hypothetical protein
MSLKIAYLMDSPRQAADSLRRLAQDRGRLHRDHCGTGA